MLDIDRRGDFDSASQEREKIDRGSCVRLDFLLICFSPWYAVEAHRPPVFIQHKDRAFLSFTCSFSSNFGDMIRTPCMHPGNIAQ